MNQEQIQEYGADFEPVEPETDLATVQSEGDPEAILLLLEKKAALAPRYKAALEAVLVSQTYAADWTRHDKMMCVSSAGAERVGRLFPIQFRETRWRKEEFSDSVGKGYRYVYETYATMGGRVAFAMGIYSTREAFLGRRNDEYRDVLEINENSIQLAAYHCCIGNAVKSLLGLRGIPVEEWERIMRAQGADPDKARTAPRGNGTSGGTSADDTAKQSELAKACIAIAQAGKCVGTEDHKNYYLKDLSPEQAKSDSMAVAKDICVELSSFVGDKGHVSGKGAKELKGKWLDSTLNKARTVLATLNGNGNGKAGVK